MDTRNLIPCLLVSSVLLLVAWVAEAGDKNQNRVTTGGVEATATLDDTGEPSGKMGRLEVINPHGWVRLSLGDVAGKTTGEATALVQVAPLPKSRNRSAPLMGASAVVTPTLLSAGMAIGSATSFRKNGHESYGTTLVTISGARIQSPEFQKHILPVLSLRLAGEKELADFIALGAAIQAGLAAGGGTGGSAENIFQPGFIGSASAWLKLFPGQKYVYFKPEVSAEMIKVKNFTGADGHASFSSVAAQATGSVGIAF